MASSERTIGGADRGFEESDFLSAFSSILKKDTKTVERQQLPTIDEKSIFASPHDTILTTFGLKINGILTERRRLLSDKELTHQKRKEIQLSISSRCENLNIPEEWLPIIEKHFEISYAARSARMDSLRQNSPIRK